MTNNLKTKGQLEALISEAIIQFEKDYMGRGPTETKTYLVDNLVIIKLQGVLTPSEKQLANSAESDSGRELIKKMRHALLQKGRCVLDGLVGVPLQARERLVSQGGDALLQAADLSF